MYDAFVLAAGFGTRLQPLTVHRPKPLVPVCGVPMLSYALALCARHDLRRVVVNAHWLSEQILAWEGEHEGVCVSVSVESPEILGTGGGLKRVAETLAPRFAVVNADVLCDVDLRMLIDAVPSGGAAMALRSDPVLAPSYGIVAADASGCVVELAQIARAVPEGTVDRSTFFTGIHALDRLALDTVPSGFSCIVRTAYRALVPARQVRAVRHAGRWLDIGDPVAYLSANLAILEDPKALPLDPHARAAWARSRFGEVGSRGALDDASVEGSAWIGRGARIGAGTRLSRTIVGANAEVPPGCILENTVVWDGVRLAPGEYRNAIAYDGGVLQL